MLYIKKMPAPPNVQRMLTELEKSEEWRNIQPGDGKKIRNAFDSLDKTDIRKAIRKEQHGLCAYCMKKLPSLEEGKTFKVEHFVPVSSKGDSKDNLESFECHKKNALNYKNMLGCCFGGEDAKSSKAKVLCCDASKKETPITIDPRNKAFTDRIRYRRNGEIYVLNATKEEKYDIDNVLRLNGKKDSSGRIVEDTSTQLVENRAAAYMAYERFMGKLAKELGNNDERIATELKKRIAAMEKAEEYPEFFGVTLFFMKRRAGMM